MLAPRSSKTWRNKANGYNNEAFELLILLPPTSSHVISPFALFQWVTVKECWLQSCEQQDLLRKTLITSELSFLHFNPLVTAEWGFAIHYPSLVIKPICSNLELCLNYHASTYFYSLRGDVPPYLLHVRLLSKRNFRNRPLTRAIFRQTFDVPLTAKKTADCALTVTMLGC